MKIKSTLPLLFTKQRLASEQSPQHQQNNHKTIIPRSNKLHRQGGIYDLNLTISYSSGNGRSNNKFGTKIITIPADRTQRSKSVFSSHRDTQKYQKYGKNDVAPIQRYSIGKHKKKNSHGLSINLQGSINNTSGIINTSRYQNNDSITSKEGSIKNKTLQQINNTNTLMKNITQNIYLLNKKIQQIPEQSNQLYKSINQTRIHCEQQIDRMNKQYTYKVKQLKNKLSEMRRVTGMQIKVHKKQLEEMSESIRDSIQITNDIEAQRRNIRDINT